MDDSNVFENNEALYGDDIATFPSYLQVIFLQNNDYHDPIDNNEIYLNTPRGELHTTVFERLVSGVPFSFLVYILD